MVDFMLQTGGEQPRCMQFMALAVAVEITHFDFRGPGYHFIIFGDRQATFLVVAQCLARPRDLGVGDEQRLLLLALL